MNQTTDLSSGLSVGEGLPAFGDSLPPVIEEKFRALIARAAEREPRYDGIPAVLIVDDFGVTPKRDMTLAEGDAEVGRMYAWAATALAALIEADGGDPYYPSICPAMSLVAELAFADLPFDPALLPEDGAGMETIRSDFDVPDSNKNHNGNSEVPHGTSDL